MNRTAMEINTHFSIDGSVLVDFREHICTVLVTFVLIFFWQSDLIDELSFAKDIPIPQTVRTATKRERSEERPAQASTPAFNNIITSDTPTNMWAANYIPQYSGREDFPSIPMQIPVSTTGTFDYTTSTGHVLGEPLQAIEDQMFWQAPMGFE